VVKLSDKQVKLSDKQVELISAAVAEPRRFKILKDLAGCPGAMACAKIVDKHDVSQATISHHLKELSVAGLIDIERDGKCNNITLKRDVWAAYLERLAELT
jgi:ArsR family transcriptional regulator, arsenate/arsenite/antimonite-responsive transcriptional repressor